MSPASQVDELPVTFQPSLYLQRRGWVLDIMRREGVTEVLDIGCGEGELLSCLCNPAPWLAPPPEDMLSSPPAHRSDASESISADALADLHEGVLHPVRIAGLDICKTDLECAVRITAPRAEEKAEEKEDTPMLWHGEPVRWEPLEAKIWEGSFEDVNPEFVGVECIVATEVIEHLAEDVLQRFAPVVLGAYCPRVLAITTPSYTFNARFTAPDAPHEARLGWYDPTGRTDRVFRHEDHKFEWTVKEFEEWCIAVAEEWGYDVEIGGVGKAQEVDEWGRDDELGWASQVAAFTRREGGEWMERRKKLWEDSDRKYQRTHSRGTHQLLTAHYHPAHKDACHPKALKDVGDLVVSTMIQFSETRMSLTEIWFQHKLELACGGWIDWLVYAIQAHLGLDLHRSIRGLTTEWIIHLGTEFHHLLPPELQKDAWASPPDTEELIDQWPSCDDNACWGTNFDGAVVRQMATNGGYADWDSLSEDSGRGTLGEPNATDWGNGEKDGNTDIGWGPPEQRTDMTWGV